MMAFIVVMRGYDMMLNMFESLGSNNKRNGIRQLKNVSQGLARGEQQQVEEFISH